MKKWATGIFTSIRGGLGAGLDSVRSLGVSTVQLHAPAANYRTPERTAQMKDQFKQAGIEVTVVFAGFEDDEYTTVERVVQTVGLVPKDRRERRLKEVLEISDFARNLGVEAIGMHLGFVPPDDQDPEFRAVVEVTRKVCDHCAGNRQNFHLETGQETAQGLLHFIEAVGRPNLAVNFDPANMILYGAGNPLQALDLVGKYVKSVHCKDASYTRKPGQPWYEDAPLGQGDVGIEAFLRKLNALGYEGALTIEREYSPDQAGDLKAALSLLESLRAKVLGA
ncbi:MAG: sugar phosphate isomerase/epimerase [Candidatus Handelsmanbacteria bacterium]|nr:sugar phosphate isomerase/epimerase [Candidatus Handelsmanbacteria bacterium]